MDEKWSLRVEFEAQAKNLLNTVEQVIGSLGDLQTVAEGEVAKSLSKLERDLNKAAGGMRKAVSDIDDVTEAVQEQSKELKKGTKAWKEYGEASYVKDKSRAHSMAIKEDLARDKAAIAERLKLEKGFNDSVIAEEKARNAESEKLEKDRQSRLKSQQDFAYSTYAPNRATSYEKEAQKLVDADDKAFAARRKAADSFYKEMVSTDKRVNAEIARDQKAEADNRYRQAVASNKQIIKDERTAQQDRSNAIRSGMEQRLRAEKEHANQLAELQKQYDGLANTRYALYDVARTWTVVAGATTGALLAVEGVGASYEHAFADVARTFDGTEQQTAKLRQDLKHLTQEIPESFGSLAEVATLAGQLDIAAGNIASFTETVVMFAATTDVTTEQAAMSLGRLIQLTDATQAQTQNLAAAIYETGVNSVATEGQILSMSQEIATVGDLAGFSSAEVVGLASALASIGEQPERSRSSLLRFFSRLNSATALGGDDLTQFARLAGMSADEFTEAWTNRPEQAFRSLLQGMQSAMASGKNLDLVLRDLGITNVRESQMLMRLANNMGVYVATQDDANRAFAEGTALQEGFGERTDTLISSLTLLRNTVGSIMDNLSNSNLLKPVVDSINNVLVVIDKLTESPIARGIAAITGGLVALVAGIAVYNAALFRARASVAGLMQAKIALNAQQVNLRGGLLSLYREYQALTARINEATAATAANTTATNANTGASNANAIAKRSQGMANLATNTTGAAGALSSFGTMAKGALRFLGPIGVGLGIAHVAFSNFADGVRDSRAEAEQASKSFESLREAVALDAGAETSYRIITSQLPVATDETQNWANVLHATADAQRDLSDATSSTTDAIDEQVTVIGENVKNQVIQNLLGREGFQDALTQYAPQLQEMGIDIAELLVQGLEQGPSVIQSMVDELSNKRAELEAEYNSLPLGHMYQENATALLEEIALLDERLKVYEAVLVPLQQELDAIEAVAHATDLAAQSSALLGADLEDGADAAYTLAEAMADAFSQTDNIMATENAIHNLTQAFYDNGAGLDVYSVEGRANMAALQSAIESIYQSNAPEQANAIALGILQNLENQGLATRQELEAAYRAVQLLSNNAGIGGITEEQALRGRIRAFEAMDRAYQSIGSRSAPKANRAIRDTGRAAREAEKEVRTLTDYMRDLQNVMGNAFDIRFGLDISTDNLADQFEDMKDWAADAARAVRDITQNIRELNATITGLRASNNTLEYQLRVAREYGDELREQEILAEIAKNNADISKAQNDRTDATKDLKKAQDQTNKSLRGNTRGSREQRSQVLALVKAYQDQVAELANTNISQAELERRVGHLRRAFEDQMRQLGYSETEIRRYSSAFDDMAVVIRNVPRNITVNANVSPGQRAVNEFLARTNKRTATVNVRANVPKNTPLNVTPRFPSNATLTARDIALAGSLTARKGGSIAGTLTASRISSNAATIQTMVFRQVAGAASAAAAAALFRAYGGGVPQYLASGGIGGMHPGGPRGTDTIPAWLTPGEYVHNKKAVSYYGLPFMNALNNMQVPRYLATGGPTVVSTSSGRNGPVELGPRSLAALRQEMVVVLNGRMVGEAINKRNAQQGVLGSA